MDGAALSASGNWRGGDVRGGDVEDTSEAASDPAPALASNVDDPARRPRHLKWWFTAVVVVAAVPRLHTAGRYTTVDEPRWMSRSERFYEAITTFDLSSASASVGEPATMPGGPTMWIGTLARIVWGAGRELGWVHSRQFTGEDGTAIAQYVAALVVAALIGWLFVAVTRWVGLAPALLASLLVATDPWLVALGAVLHTDVLTALFGTLGLVYLARALRLPDSERIEAHPARLAVLGGAVLMAAPLTKVTGAGYVVGAWVMLGWAMVRHRRAGGRAWEPGSPLRLGAVAAAAGLAMVPVMWPALVADPVFQFERLRAAVGLANESAVFYQGSRQYYLGERVDSPGWTYYFVATAMRLTPWFLALLLVGLPAAIARRGARAYAVLLGVPAAMLFAVITIVPKTFDRYVVVVIVPLAVVAAIAVSNMGPIPTWSRSRVNAGLAVVGSLAFLHSVVVAPWGLAYFNPALGGSRTGQEVLLVGWGEGIPRAQRWIAEQDERCSQLEGERDRLPPDDPCALPEGVGREPAFVALYISTDQRDPTVRAELEAEGREVVKVIEIRGIPYVEIWR